LGLRYLTGRFSGVYNWPVLGVHRGVGIRPVTVGSRVDSLWVIERGLHPGERVVAEETQKVRDGATVAVAPYQPPAAAR
jgi:hypothetical protein